jgi:hypothetical protein
LDLFQRNGLASFDKGLLADFADRHPAIALIRAARRVYDLQKERILTGEFVGADGRVHPEYRHLTPTCLRRPWACWRKLPS